MDSTQHSLLPVSLFLLSEEKPFNCHPFSGAQSGAPDVAAVAVWEFSVLDSI
jgi:hypothetical protein